MIYWLFILALIVEIFLYVKIYNDALGVAVQITCIITLFLTIVIIFTNIQAKHEKYELETSYNTLLEYKSVSDYLQNEHYISDIIRWNTTISTGKSIQRDFWVGIFIPNIYDDFDIITLKED